jgi:hypothetical protein
MFITQMHLELSFHSQYNNNSYKNKNLDHNSRGCKIHPWEKDGDHFGRNVSSYNIANPISSKNGNIRTDNNLKGLISPYNKTIGNNDGEKNDDKEIPREYNTHKTTRKNTLVPS